MAPTRAASVSAWQPLTMSACDDAAADRVGHLGADKAPARVENGGHEHRGPGESTLVETIVAMELAESWAPLVKSNTRRHHDDHQNRVRSVPPNLPPLPHRL